MSEVLGLGSEGIQTGLGETSRFLTSTDLFAFIVLAPLNKYFGSVVLTENNGIDKKKLVSKYIVCTFIVNSLSMRWIKHQ